MRGVSRIAEMSRITFWVNIYGFPKFNFSKNQFLSELDFHGVPPTNGIFLPTPQPQVYVTNSNICHHLMFPNFSGFLPAIWWWFIPHDSIENPKLNSDPWSKCGWSILTHPYETFTLNMKLFTKWDLKSSLSEHDRG